MKNTAKLQQVLHDNPGWGWVALVDDGDGDVTLIGWEHLPTGDWGTVCVPVCEGCLDLLLED